MPNDQHRNRGNPPHRGGGSGGSRPPGGEQRRGPGGGAGNPAGGGPGGWHHSPPFAGGGHGGPAGHPPGGPGGPGPHGAVAGNDLQLAAPGYLQHLPLHHFQQAPPGHAFRQYFRGWAHDWTIPAGAKRESLESLTTLNERVFRVLQSTVSRQRSAAQTVSGLCIPVTCTAPFTTGLGIEHPLENGFAFLDPYGLPYLPGSSVKGVVRRAAEELALFETESHGWSVPAVWWLFGFDATSAFFAADDEDPQPILDERRRWREALSSRLERLSGRERELLEQFVALACPPRKDAPVAAVTRIRGWIPENGGSAQEIREIHTRGALEFWDVIPEPADGKLRVDIMNPHYNHYYQDGKPPGDWGNPVPIYFLTLPPGTTFTFITRFRPPTNWPEKVRAYFETKENATPRWQRLLTAALAFAFEWLGFGAKTAVGYGRMAADAQRRLPDFQLPKGPGGA